ncbi:MAG: transposase [Hyphomicrobiaceae bacterium]|nr:transposase [Hyphomicrobiaceae bacterium]
MRFIVTNLPGRGKNIYEKTYCQRGNMENLIKEHKLYTKSDRTSCHRKEANQFRLSFPTAFPQQKMLTILMQRIKAQLLKPCCSSQPAVSP